MVVFKIGNVVRLNSGGPNMTITNVKDDTCHCCWFVESVLKEEDFLSAMLLLRKE